MSKNENLNLTEEEKRAKRHSRRIRSQIFAIIIAVLLVVALVAGAIFGIRLGITKLNASRQANQQEAEVAETEQQEETPNEQEELIQDLIGEETELPEAPDPDVEPELSEEELAAQRLEEIVEAAIDAMSLQDKVAGLFITSPESITGVSVATQAGNGTKEALQTYAVGGLVYSSKNVQSKQQFTEMLANTQSYVNYPTFFAVAEEGGKSTVLGDSFGLKIASAADLGEAVAGTGSVDEVRSASTLIAQTMAAAGLNMVLGPVADVAVAEGNVLGSRSYGSDVSTVATASVNAMFGFADNGVNACAKYFPGLGSCDSNPSEGRVMSERTLEQLRAEEFQVYSSLIASGVPAIMMSNAIYPELDENSVPGSLSASIVTDVLRNELGFEGVIISGSLSDKSISEYYGADEAAILALKAGCDMLQTPENFEKAYNGILTALEQGVIDENRIDDALRRIYRIKLADRIE